MDRPEVKHRVAVSYIVAMVCLIAIVIVSQLLVNNRAKQTADPVDGTSDAVDIPNDETEDLPVDDSSYAALESEFCTYNEYRYRVITDTEELATLGLPSSVTKEVLGGNFATADNRVALYAYPAYGCRAVLIANSGEAYSFCVLDGFTDSSKVQTLDAIPPMYGMNAASDVAESALIHSDGTRTTIDAENLEQFYNFLSGCSNAGEKAPVTDPVVVALTSRTGVVLELNYYSDISLISVLGEYYTVTDDLTALILSLID